MITAPAVLVHGTHGLGNGWYQPASPFRQMLAAGGIPTIDQARPFGWIGNLDGLRWKQHTEWRYWGQAFTWYVRDTLREHSLPALDTPVSVVAHSHGGNLLAYAVAEYKLPVDIVVTIATPVRADLTEHYKAMRAAARRWVHVASDETSGWGWQQLGQFTWRHPLRWLFPMRQMPEAHLNLYERGFGHGDMVRDPWMWYPEHCNWRDQAFAP